MALALHRLGPLHFHISRDGAGDPFQLLKQEALDAAVVQREIQLLVWGGQLGLPLDTALGPARPLTVKTVTALQMRTVVEQRAQRHC